jgi:hypothetical protein
VFDVVCCVNLNRRPDRWDDFIQRFPADWPYRKPTRFPATDGQLCPPPPWWTEGGGAWGCMRSHFRILEECLNSRFQSVLILEDDALFPDEFVRDAQAFLEHLPSDWQMAYLGGQLLRDNFRPPHKVNDWVYRPYNVNRTHAYAVRGTEMLRVLYDHLLSRDWFERHHIDHHYGRLHQTGRHNVYVPRRWLVGQLGGESDVSAQETQDTYWNHAEESHARGADPFVMVLGLHESAASRVALALHHLGLYMGHDLGGSANPSDAEDQALGRLCERAAPFPATEFTMGDFELGERLEDWLGNHMWQARLANKPSGAKYPHLCAIGSYFRRFCGDKLRVIDVRDPLDAAVGALQGRLRRMPNPAPDSDARAARVQEWLLREKEKVLAAVPHLSLGRAYLESNPEAAAKSIVAYLNLTPDAEQFGRAVAALSATGVAPAVAAPAVAA